LLRVKNLLTK